MFEAGDNGRDWQNVVVLSGGLGGARLIQGLAKALGPGVLTTIVNTGDDFRHWGLHISPDIDRIVYTMTGVTDQNPIDVDGEGSFRVSEMVAKFGGEKWLQIPDAYLATHLLRTEALTEGQSLSGFTRRLCEELGLHIRVLPMSDQHQKTMLKTRLRGTMSFPQWEFQHGCEPSVERVWFQGSREPAPGVLEAIDAAELVIIAPSNPLVSIDPILCMQGVRRAVARKPTIAISPIVRGRAAMGPLDRMLHQVTGVTPSATSVVAHYRALIRGIVVERGDEVQVTGLPVLGTETLTRGVLDRLRFAREILRFASLIH